MIAAEAPRRAPLVKPTAGALVFLVFLAAALLAPGAVSPALAAPGGKRVGVHVSGKDARHVEKGILQALKKHRFAAVKGKPLAAAAKGAGGLDSDRGRAAAVRRLKLRAVIIGEITDRGRRAELRVHGADGEVITAGDFKAAGGGKKLAAAVGRGLWPKLGDALEGARPSKPVRSSEPEPEPEPSKPAVAAAPPPAAKSTAKPTAAEDPWATPAAPSASPSKSPSPSDDAPREIAAEKVSRPRPDTGSGDSSGPAESVEAVASDDDASDSASPSLGPALDVMAGLRLVSRDLSWVKDVNQSLQPFSMPGAASFGFQLAWYPAAHFMTGWPTQIGIAASGEYVPGISASTSDGVEYPATDSDYWAGLRGRMPLGTVDGALTVAYGQHAYVLRSSAAGTRADLAVPDTRYTYARVGADVRVHLPYKLSLLAGAAYRAVLDAGKQGFEVQSATFFQRATVTALDVSAAVGYRFLPMFEARAGADFRRYGIDMHPQPTDVMIVSGGIDHYIAFWLNLAVMLDGRGRATN